ncbi:hypothetical protein ACKI16_47825, partial [Streptomyces scabiei]|uniref:hypothetical protein n=1 Tax=Streptomyces scabiei TaxID=1930 RepID=UPI0038F6548B
MTNALFEIKFVEHEDPFYQKGKLYVYKLKVELYEFNNETFNTTDTEIDGLLDNLTDIDTETQVTDYFGDNDYLEDTGDL